jgi:phenylpyruvate tautomerase PptA (4-oxalocrotonate tautomerase family)
MIKDTGEGRCRTRVKLKGESMPTFVCTAATGRLTPVQKTEIARSIADIYHEVTGAPRYFVQVIFHDVAPGDNYVAGRPAPADKILIRGDTRSGKTNEQRSQIVRRIMQDVGRAGGAPDDALTVLLCEIPIANVAEYGRVAPSPEEDDAWFSSLPDAMQERLKRLA